MGRPTKWQIARRAFPRFLLGMWGVGFVILALGCSEGAPVITGQAFVQGLHQVEFTARPGQEQDFLFVVDDSTSMRGEIDEVRASLNAFFALLNSRRLVDYQVAVTTTNAETVAGQLKASPSGVRVVKSTTPNAISHFSGILAQIDPNEDVPGKGREQGYRAAELAIEKYGSEFMRDGVPLAIVIVSDAPDKSCRLGKKCSRSDYTSVRDQADYFRQVRGPAGGLTKVLLFPISAIQHGDCSGGLEGLDWENWAANGHRYADVQAELGTGAFGLICEAKLTQSLERTAEDISSRGLCYNLPGNPTGTEISVFANGGLVAEHPENGFHFDASTQSICFAGSVVPSAGSKIHVAFRDAQ